jgi:multidrug efflux pump subunit AcrA (membrane-fusion protein)
MNRQRIILVLIVLVGAAGGLTWRFVLDPNDPNGKNVVRVSGNVELIDVEMAFKIPGLVAERPVDEGYDVHEGQLVAKLETRDLRADLDMREAELGMAEWALKELQAGSRDEEKAAAKAAMEKAAAAMKALKSDSPRLRMEAAKAAAALKAAEFEQTRLEKELTRATEMRRRNPDALSQEQYDQQKAAYDVAVSRRKEAEEQHKMTGEPARLEQLEQAQKAFEQAKAQWELVENGPRPQVIKQAEAKFQQAKAAVQLAELRFR